MDFSKQEKHILSFWKSIRAFEKSILKRPKNRQFIFFEGPPTANGLPGLHHVEARSYKDIILRYKTMQGFRVERKAGWDTHGLPVELEVEKKLGLKSKKDIEEYGIEKFNEECRKSVWTYKQKWEQLTERMGFWLDMSNPYITYDPLYIETVWWVIKEAYKKDLLYEGHRVVPYCPRCQTPLSSHEVAQGYKDVTDTAVYIKFKISARGGSVFSGKNTYLLAWTTTPWTLPGNVALAVGEKIEYVLVKPLDPARGDDRYVIAKERLNVLDGEYTVIKNFTGKDLVGMEYEPIFNIKDLKSDSSYKVYPANFVTTEEGTGIVHTAVMYGEDDYILGEKFGLPGIHTVEKDGTFNERVPKWRGVFVKDADAGIISDLNKQGLLYKEEKYKHAYPFCWRCNTPLLYYATAAWFLAMRNIKDDLLKNNKKVSWVPAHLKDGRMGEWLRELKDWTLSRSRYWGTPLPVWRCVECNRVEVIGSREELRKKKFSANTYFILRHGEATKNVSNIISSSLQMGEKHPLTDNGKKRIKNLAEELLKKGGVDIIVSSDIRRARESAEIVGKELGIPVIHDKNLREYNVGVLDGKPESALGESIPDVADRFIKKTNGGETLSQVQKRMLRAMQSLEKKYQDKRILIVSHGDPIWILESAMEGLSIKETVVRNGKKYPRMGELRALTYRNFPYNKAGELDLHRPYVDYVFFECSGCMRGNTMERVKEVMDSWLDSGSMPYAQIHYPFDGKKNHTVPADYISEAVDQTRGWFYTLLAVSSILGDGPAYKNVISLGHVLDKKGKKMSKSVGNVVDPGEIMQKYSADALRWYFYTVNNPGDVKRFDEREIRERHNKYIGTLWNIYVFYKTYMTKTVKTNKPKAVTILDSWILARLEQTKKEVVSSLDSYNIPRAARSLENFVLNDLSNWYIRRSRRRFQKPQSLQGKEQAVSILRYIILHTALYTAPFTPFIAEAMFGGLFSNQKNSVHWELLPKAKALTAKEKNLISSMDRVREIVQEGLRIRANEGIRVRQPLASVIISDKENIPAGLKDLLREELNVKKVIVKKQKNLISLDTKLTSELLKEGLVKEIIRNVQGLRKTTGLRPHNNISTYYNLTAVKFQPGAGPPLTKEFEKLVADETNSTSVEERFKEAGKEKFLGEITFKWLGDNVWIGIKKS